MSQTQKSQKKQAKEHQMAYFKGVLKDVGVSLRYDDMPNILSQEQALVIRDMQKTLKSYITYPNNVNEFITGLKLLCHGKMYFQKALLPTTLNKPDEYLNVESTIQQDSLIRLLLNVACLQNEVIIMLLGEISNSAIEESNDTSWLRLLLNSLRYLSHINDPSLLTTKLLDTLEIATYPAQLEILNLIPEIIPDDECENVAKQLSKLLKENNELIGAITDCLNSLNLNLNVRSELQEQILQKFECITSVQAFPILFEFLIADCNGKQLQTVLMSARNALDVIMSRENSNKEIESNKVLIFNCLQAFATARKTLQENWINVLLTVQNSADHKSIDLLILFMLHFVGRSHKSAVESVIRKRIKGGYFKVSLLENLLQKYLVPQILKDYFNSMLEIADGLLKFAHEPVFIEFGSTMYKMLFNHQLMDQVHCQELIENLISLIGTNEKKNITFHLNILMSMKEDFTKLQQHAIHLMSLIERLDTVDLKNAQLIFDLLCSLICGENANESLSGFKDEIHMIIRKQLSSAKKAIKHCGIVGAVVMAKVLAITSKKQNAVSADDSLTIADLPCKNLQEAAGLLELANTCTLDSSDSLGLYYDQLALMLSTTCNLDNYLVAWLYQQITNNFENIFVTQSTVHHINDIPISMQYSLNTEEETSTPIAINIAELTLKKSTFEQKNSITILPPLFRLLRLVHYRQHNGDLGTIDALLGCAVVLPNLKDISNYETDQLKQISDCLFHCINWFRETTSAFVTQKSKSLRTKVLQRISDIIQLEEILEQCLINIPEHKLPLCYFDSLSQLSPIKSNKPSNPKKKQKTSQATINLNETVASTSVITQQIKATMAPKKKNTKELNREKINFREMDTDIILLLRYSLNISSEDNLNESFSQPTQSSRTLTIQQFNFLMKDLVFKVDILTKNKNVGPYMMSMVNVVDFIGDCIRLLPSINRQLISIIRNLEKTLKQLDGCTDAKQMFTPEVNNVKLSFSLILNCYALIFGWSEFQHIKHASLLKDCLKALTKDEQSQIISTKEFVMEFTETLTKYTKYCLCSPAAVSLVQIMKALYSINSSPEIKKKMTATAGKLLTTRWYNFSGELEVGKTLHINIDILVKTYLNGASVKTVCGLVATIQAQISGLKCKEDCLPILSSITKANFYILYRNLCITLLEAVRTEVVSLTNNQHLLLWRTTALTMQGLMTIVKIEETKTNLISFLKNSLGILKVFLSSGIPIFEIMLRSKADEVVEIFKIMQNSTRFLHHLCCYSKFTKDTSLVTYVPHFRLTLESLLYRVKAALVANNCSAAFWMGTLKNRDLQGQDILSQSSMESEESNEIPEDDEQLPSDEDEGVITHARNESDADSSASDVF